MVRKITVLTVFLSVVCVAPLWAQRVEVTVLAGWTFSDGVEAGQSVITQDGEVFDRVDPQDSFKWSLSVGVLATDALEVGFQYGNQPTKLEAGGTTTREIGDLTVSTYHGYLSYNFLDSDSKLRPFALFGLGATNFSSVDFTTLGGQSFSTDAQTQFSTTWAAGLKYFASPHFGARFSVQWTPTYIKTDSEGWWCDPWFGCYVVGDPQYSSQWDLAGGVVFKF